MKRAVHTSALHWLGAAAIAFALSCAYLLDGPSEVDAAQAVADDLVAAQTAGAQP